MYAVYTPELFSEARPQKVASSSCADQPQRERAGLRSQQSEQSQAQTWSSEPAGVNQCVGGEPANHAIRG